MAHVPLKRETSEYQVRKDIHQPDNTKELVLVICIRSIALSLIPLFVCTPR
jgi:hypothetical protein